MLFLNMLSQCSHPYQCSPSVAIACITYVLPSSVLALEFQLLRRLEQEDQRFKACVGYRVTLKPTLAI